MSQEKVEVIRRAYERCGTTAARALAAPGFDYVAGGTIVGLSGGFGVWRASRFLEQSSRVFDEPHAERAGVH